MYNKRLGDILWYTIIASLEVTLAVHRTALGDRRLRTHWWLSRQLDVHAELGPTSNETETKSREVIIVCLKTSIHVCGNWTLINGVVPIWL